MLSLIGYFNKIANMRRTQAKCLLLLFFVALQTTLPAFGQTTPFPIQEWAKELNTKEDPEITDLTKISWNTLRHYDSATVYSCFKQLENSGESGPYLKAKLSFMKAADVCYRAGDITRLGKLCEQSLYDAYETRDNYLIAYICWFFGLVMESRNELELSVFFYLKADDTYALLKQVPSYIKNYRLNLGEILYRTGDYQKCIDYTKKGLANYTDTSEETAYNRIRYINTIGQAYKQLGQLDSALANYQRSVQVAYDLNDGVWIGINAVFMGEAWLLKKDYVKAKQFIQSNSRVKDPDINVLAYGLQLLAKIDLIQGDKDSARLHIKESLHLLRNTSSYPLQKMDYLQHAYYTAANVFRAVGNADSFYHYSQSYTALHDSLQKIVTLSSMKVAQLRINNEKNYQTLQQLQKQKETEALTRNFIIVFIIMLSLIAILALNRQRQKANHKEQLALQQKEVAEANMAVADAEKNAAAEQLSLFTQNLIEKTILIEKLEQQLKASEHNIDQQQLIEELTHQTILTEDDWLKFKLLFEKTHPGFFTSLKMQATDVTLAEQRMAGLTRLHLTTKQMAAALGISPNSVIKAKQRLRQRFNLETDLHVEAFLDNL